MRTAAIIFLSFCFMISLTKIVSAEIPIQNSDAETLGVLSVIDQNEIKAAQLAQQKNVDPTIMEYAKMLDQQHNQHLIKTQEFSQQSGIPIVNHTSSIDQLRANGEQDLAALAPLNGESFSQLYIADMIKGHSDVLNWIDRQGAQHDKVKDFLKETRGHIVMHLDKAFEIQKHQKIGQV